MMMSAFPRVQVAGVTRAVNKMRACIDSLIVMQSKAIFFTAVS